MNPAQHAALLLLLTGLVGCESTLPRGGGMDRVQSELEAAARSQPSRSEPSPEARRALLPPLLLAAEDAARREVEPRFDLAVNGAPAAQVFMAIVSGSRYSMLVHPEVKGELTVNLKNVTVREALDTLRDLYGYEYRIDGSRVSILPNTLQTHLFQVNYLAGQRQGMTDMRVTSGSIVAASAPASAGAPTSAPGTRGPDSSSLTTRLEHDFWAELRQALTAIVGGEGGRAVIVNPLSGVVVVRGYPADIRNVGQYLAATQGVIERQVMLEAKILEVRLSEGFQSGINWAAIGTGLRGTPFALSSNLGGAAFQTSAYPFIDATREFGALNPAAVNAPVGLAFQTDSFAALLRMIESQGDIQVLSSPRIATLNNQKAVLKVGTDEFYVTNVSTTTTSNATGNVTTPTLNLQPFFSGIALDVTPQIDGTDNVILHVNPSISQVSERQKVIDLGANLGSFTLPLASSTVNQSDSVVRVKDGHIVAIGGLFTQEQRADQSGLPGLAGRPLFGDLFGQRGRSQAKREIVILIKPTILNSPRAWQSGLDEVRARLSDFGPAAPVPGVSP